MSKELIVRLRKFIGGELGNGAADALESLEAAYSGAVEAGKALAKQALKAERERDAFEKAAGEEAKKYLEEREKRIAAEADRDTLAAELKALRVTQQAPTTDDINMQNWNGMDGACAWHLIDRHADDWSHVARLMNAWLEANREDLVTQERTDASLIERAMGHPVVLEIMADCAVCIDTENSAQHDIDIDGPYSGAELMAKAAELRTKAVAIRKEDPDIWPALAYPTPGRELTDEEILNALDAKVETQFLTRPVTCKELWLTAGSVDVREFVRAIEAAMRGE